MVQHILKKLLLLACHFLSNLSSGLYLADHSFKFLAQESFLTYLYDGKGLSLFKIKLHISLSKRDTVLNHNHCRPYKCKRSSKQHDDISQILREQPAVQGSCSCSLLIFPSTRLQCTGAQDSIKHCQKLKPLSKQE